MASDSLSQRKAQLDKEEREHLEDIVTEMRVRVEDNIKFQLTQKGLDEEPAEFDELNKDTRTTAEAIDLEGVDGHTWNEAFEEYVTGVGYTIVNRLAALRCMEVRDFIDREVTTFKENGLTPAAEPLTDGTEDFLLEDEAIIQGYHDACDELAEEIDILFDRDSAYSQVDPDDDTFEELCGMLDEIPDEVWRADDVLGWVYEYYNRPVVEALDDKNTLAPEDVGPANQFYTPHWVVRMLADNSLGKLYLEATDQENAIPEPEAISPMERKNRLATPADAPSVPELCTYLIPDEEPGDAPEFGHPRELRVIDPACGSGHFLLYAFDILERIWWAETDLNRAEIPAKVLKHNLYGVDIDLRSCQLSAFNLYLKARTRAEAEDGQFEMPNVGIVCGDARVAEVEEATEVLDEITGEGSDLREALDDVIETFQQTEALGSLLDVSGTLEEAFDSSKTQAELSDYNRGAHQSLNSFLKALRRAVEDRTSDSFGEQNLRSFLNLLVVLTQEYDTALMNPPYGARKRMPSDVTDYVEEHYKYGPEYYINFFEVCERFSKQHGRVGMIVQRSFMYKSSFQDFREDFLGELGVFDFLAEYGNGVLDNATVRTAGTVVRTDTSTDKEAVGTFYRLHDLSSKEKESSFLEVAFGSSDSIDIQREYRKELGEFSLIPTTPLSYWASLTTRELYDSEMIFEERREQSNKTSLGVVRQGLATGDNPRFVDRFWEHGSGAWVPYTKGGSDAWVLPRIDRTLLWGENGEEVRRSSGGNGTPSEEYYFQEALTYTYMKSSGRRFGYLHGSSIFGHAGNVFIPEQEDAWKVLGYSNSHLLTYLMLCQTPERQWEVGNVSNLPWPSEVAETEELADKAKEIAGALLSLRRHDFRSPHYAGPSLIGDLEEWAPKVHQEHPHREMSREIVLPDEDSSLTQEMSIKELGVRFRRKSEYMNQRMEAAASEIEDILFEALELTNTEKEEIYTEIALRTNQDPREQEEYNPEAINEPSEEFPEQVKDLLLHFALRTVQENNDGIIPFSDIDEENDLLTHIENEFERVWGEYAADRLAEVDEVLGSKSAAEEPYPNLRTWLEEDLFDYHVSKFDRTPILWRFTTERLVSDPEGEGFGCLVDYQQLDEGVFDRLQSRYLEPRKNLLRERRSAANRRRSDDSLSASEQAEAAEEYAQCESGLEQINMFEDRLAELAQSNPRNWPEDKQTIAESLLSDIDEFQTRLENRLDSLYQLREVADEQWLEDTFTPTFWEYVDETRGEWIDELEDLKDACRAYANDATVPVEAHYYDLFDHFEELIGTTSYHKNGVLFLTYYFDKFEGQTQLGDGENQQRSRLCAELGSNLDEFTELAQNIQKDCSEIAKDIPSDWADRALSEITTAGYQPNHKHGVEINITPLADAEIVPKTVDDDVL